MFIVLYCTWLCYTPPEQPIIPLNPLTRGLHLFPSVSLLFSSLFSPLSSLPISLFLFLSSPTIRSFSFAFFFFSFLRLYFFRSLRFTLSTTTVPLATTLYFLRSLTTLASRLSENPVIPRRQSSFYLRFPVYATGFLTQTGEDCRLYSFRFLYTAA